MIEPIITYLNNELEELGFFTKLYCLAEQVHATDDKMFPRQYLGNGSFEDITSVSSWLGTSYFRVDGEIKSSIDTDFKSFKACSLPLSIEVPLVFVGTVKRSSLPFDNAFTDISLAGLIMKTLTQENPLVKNEIRATTLTLLATDYSMDRQKITAQEFKGVEPQISYLYSYFSTKLKVVIKINKDCLDDLCGKVLIDENDNELIDQNTNTLEAT